MSFYNRNLVKEEFFCSDRCNTLGNSRLRGRDGTQMQLQDFLQINDAGSKIMLYINFS